jgi:Tol biopolymer transport system component
MRGIGIGAIVAALWLVAGSAAAGGHASIAFVHAGDIWLVGVDGRGAHDITRTAGAAESSPSWSPDGSQLAYLRGAEVWEMHADGTGQHRVVPGPPAGFARYVVQAGVDWSSTGELAYVTWDAASQRPEIVVANGDGSAGRTLGVDPNPPGEARTPWYIDLVWSPRGDRLYFELDNVTDRYGIFSVAPDGTGLTHLYGTSAGSFAPSLSPDGSRLVYTRPRGGGRVPDLDIRLAKSNGADPQWLTRVRGDDVDGSWSPDSRRVVFASQRGDTPLRIGSGPTDLFVIDVSGRRVHRLLHLAGTETDPQWQPG